MTCLRLLARGQSNKEIARSLNINTTTVRSHVSNILMKLNVSNRTQAVLVCSGASFAVSVYCVLLPISTPIT